MNVGEIKFDKLKIILFIIFLSIGIYLRISGINRPEGLWYDEINTYFISKQSFPLGIMQALLERDLHCPFYYMLLHLWMDIFGNSDIALRLLSALFGILTLPVAYISGKQLYGEKCGLATLFMFSINTGLIYYSQEIRFYSALVFFLTLAVLFLIKISDNPSKLNFAGLIISNLLIIYTSTIGCILVFIEMVLFLAFLLYTKKRIKNFIFSGFIMLFFSIPAIPLLIHFSIHHSALLFNYFDYYKINPTILLDVINQFASPEPPRHGIILSKAIQYFINLSSIIFLSFIIKAITKNKLVLTIFLMGLIPFLIGLIFAIQDKFSLVYYHVIFIVPFLIISASYGLFQFKNRFILSALVSIYITISLTYIFFSPYGIIKAKRNDGFNIIASKLQALHATKNDISVLIPYGGYMAIKYDYHSKVAPICLNDYSLNNGDTFKYLFDSEFIKSINKSNTYDKLKGFVNSDKPTPQFKDFVQNDLLNKIKVNGHFFIVVVNYNFLKFDKEHMIDSIIVKITKDTLALVTNDKRFKLEKISTTGSWSFFKFKRIK